MKTVKLTLSSLLILAAFAFTNCTREQVEDLPANTREIITNGKWSVDYFFANQDLTANYNNYQFSFLGNGTLTASSGSHQLNGTWSMIRDVNRIEVLRINIDTGDPSFSEMNNEWKVTDKTTVKLDMDCASNGQLSFKKL